LQCTFFFINFFYFLQYLYFSLHMTFSTADIQLYVSYTYSFLIMYVEFRFAGRQTKFCRSCPHHINGTARLLEDADTASAHAVASICILKSRLNIRRWDFLLDNKFCHFTLPKQHVLANNFLALKYNHLTGADDVILIVVRDDRWDYCSDIAHCHIVWNFFVLIRFSWVLIQPLNTKCGLNELQHALLAIHIQIGRSKRIINSNKWGSLRQDLEADKTRTFENTAYRTRWTGHVERIDKKLYW